MGCEFNSNRYGFAKTLLLDIDLKGYWLKGILIIYPKFGKTKNCAGKIADFSLQELLKMFNIPLNRLKTIYGGDRQETEIESLFVPIATKPPIPAPDEKTK